MGSNQRKVLLINKFYHDRGPAGGVGRYLVQEEEDLTAAGWQVIPFAMDEPDTRPTPWRRFFVKARDYSAPRFGAGALGDAASLIWNREAARNLDALLREVRPDVAHVHNIYHHLSPSILPVLQRHRVPVVMTLHDLRLLCPAIHMLRQGEVCERCKGRQWHQAVLGRCVKDSRAASLLAAVETAHQRSRRLYEDGVRVFLCPSRFLRDKYAEWGFPGGKLKHLPNFVDLEQWHPSHVAGGERDAYVYFGRISTEKGLRTLLETQHLWESEHAAGRVDRAPLRLLIAGAGPCEGNLRAGLARLQLSTAEYLGPLERTGLRQALARARFTVLPSECYENGPMALLESLAAGLPVVGAAVGGVPEMIVDGVTGATAPPREPAALLAAVLRACALTDGSDADAPRAARAWAEEHADRGRHMERLQAVFAEVIAAGRQS